MAVSQLLWACVFNADREQMKKGLGGKYRNYDLRKDLEI